MSKHYTGRDFFACFVEKSLTFKVKDWSYEVKLYCKYDYMTRFITFEIDLSTKLVKKQKFKND